MGSVTKISIALTEEHARAVEAAVESGDYATTSEVIRDALRGWREERELHEAEVRRLRILCDEGEASGDFGPIDIDALIADADALLALETEDRKAT